MGAAEAMRIRPLNRAPALPVGSRVRNRTHPEIRGRVCGSYAADFRRKSFPELAMILKDDGKYLLGCPPSAYELQVRARCKKCGLESDCYPDEWNDMVLSGNARHAFGCGGKLVAISPVPRGGAVVDAEGVEP